MNDLGNIFMPDFRIWYRIWWSKGNYWENKEKEGWSDIWYLEWMIDKIQESANYEVQYKPIPLLYTILKWKIMWRDYKFYFLTAIIAFLIGLAI